MTSQPQKQIIVTHILTNILRSKVSQPVKLGQLIEYNMRNVLIEKSYIKYDGETTPRLFCKKSKLSITLDQSSKV